MAQLFNSLTAREDVHKSLENYVQSKNAGSSRGKARLLETHFQRFFQYFRTPKTDVASSLMPLTKQDRAIILGQNIPPNLFDFYDVPDNQLSGTQKGNLFETRLAEVIEKLLETNIPVQVGSQKVTTGVTINVSKTSLPPKFSVVVPKTVSNGITNYIKMTLQEARNQGYNIVYPAGVSGLVDLSVPNSQLNISYTPTPFIQSFLTLLKGAQITAKSYTSMTKISTGKTGTYRILASTLPMLGHSDKLKHMAAMYTAKTQDKGVNQDKAKHLSHLVFAYQIFGMGQYIDIQGKLQRLRETNYLVVFDRSSQTIRVRSTADLAYQYIVQGKGGIARYPVINLLQY